MIGVLQGSILGPLFNIFSNDKFLFITNSKLCYYPDDNTLYSTGKNLSAVESKLECNDLILHKWLHENHMVLNPGKSHYMLIGNNSHDDQII